MRNAIFITARVASTRLPKKALQLLYGETLLIQHIIRRAKTVSGVSLIVLCTTNNDEDEILCELAVNEGIEFFRGSQEDKLIRWLDAADTFGVDYFVTFDGDDPLCEPELIELSLSQYERTLPDLIEAPNVSAGAFTYCVSVKALREVCSEKASENTEMMWVYFKENSKYRVEELEKIDEVFNRPDYRITLDYPEDLEFFRRVCTDVPCDYGTSLRTVIFYLDRHPEVPKINYYRHQEFLDNQKRVINLNFEGRR